MELALTDIWEQLGNIYGSKFINQFGTVQDSAFDSWLAVLGDFTPKQLYIGFDNLLRDKPQWAPDSFEFREYCLDCTRYGISNARTAYLHVQNHIHKFKRGNWIDNWWTHPIEPLAARSVGIQIMLSTPEKTSWPLFRGVYSNLVEKVVKGEKLDEPENLLLEKQERTKLTVEQKRSRMAELRRETGI